MQAIHIQTIFLQLLLLRRALQFQIDLYSDINNKGVNTTVLIHNCTNLEKSVINTTSAVHTHANCVQMYDQLNCTGNTIQQNQRSLWPNSLRSWNFDDRTQSVGICHDSCIPSIESSYIRANGSTFPKFPVTFFSERSFNGKAVSIEVDGCTLLPNSIELPHSVILPKGRCVLAFFSGPFFKSVAESEDKACIVDSEYSLMEFRYGMPSLDNIAGSTGLLKPPKVVRAVSPCACRAVTGVFWDWQAGLPQDDEKYIILFKLPNFLNISIKIPLNFSGCKTLSEPDGEYQEWDALAESVYVGPGSCVLVYKEPDCWEYSSAEMTIVASIPYLYYYNLGSSIRSLRVCNQTDIDNTGDDDDDEDIDIEDLVVYYYFLFVACVSCGVSLIVTVILIRMQWFGDNFDKDQNQIPEKNLEKEINEFINGLGLELDPKQEKASNESNDLMVATKINSDLLAQNQPYDYQLEIPGRELKFDPKCIIGSGQFGNVFKATFERPDASTIVAVKTTKQNSNTMYLRALLKEVKVMMYAGQHPRIVGLIGCCTAKLREGDLLIVLEYCEKGSLEKYLKANRSNFVNVVQKGQLHLEKFGITEYMKVVLGLELPFPLECNTNTGPTFDIYQLITWSIEIAEGMEYLAMKKVIHGDLSARNILLNGETTAKVADFGMSRTMYHFTHYTRNGKEPIPWRWLALESLKNMEFSTKSDVWGYGILLWEIFTLAETPYPGVSSLTDNFVQNLEQGLRPTLPSFATSAIYNKMSVCWDKEPKRRPTFTCLLSFLKEIQCEFKEKAAIQPIKTHSYNSASDSYYFEKPCVI